MTCYLHIDDKLRRPRDRSESPTPSPKRRSFDKLERCWFQAALRCDFEQLKKYYAKDRLLIDKKDNFTGFALIHWVTKKGRLDILNWVIENKGDVSARTNGGYTALHLASMHGHENIVRKLIDEYGANTECRDYSGRKPSYYLENNKTTDSPNMISPIARTVDTIDNTPTPSPKHHHNTNSHDESFRRRSSKLRRNLSISSSFKKGKKLVEKRLESSSMVQRNKSFTHFDNERNTEHRKSVIKIEHPHLKDDSIDRNNNSDNMYIKKSRELKSDIDLNKPPTEESQWTVWV